MFTKLRARAVRTEEPPEHGRSNGATLASAHRDHVDERQALDFDHLAGFTSNDRANEQRLLRLFREQAALDLERLHQAQTSKDWQRAAHSMKSSAAAVGAWRIAQTAGAAMQLDTKATDLEAALLLRELTAHLAQVNHIIALRLNYGHDAHDGNGQWQHP